MTSTRSGNTSEQPVAHLNPVPPPIPETLDIILPCYNPRKGWDATVISAVREIASRLPWTALRIILVNDGSEPPPADALITQIRSAISPVSLRYISSAVNEGKGAALRKGVLAADADLIIYTDIDFPYETESLLNLYRRLQEGQGDVVAGVRDSGYYAKVPAGRKFISRMLRRMLRLFLNLVITDTQCGLKGFNTKGRELFLQTTIDRFLFDMEFIFLASNDPRIRLAPADVKLRPDVVFSRMNLRVLMRESWNFFGIFLKFLKRKRRRK